MLIIQIHTGETLVPMSSPFEVEMAIEKLERYKSPGANKIQAEFIQARGRTIRFEIHKLINSVWNKEELPDQWRSQSLYLFISRVMKQTAAIIKAYHCYQLHTTFYHTFCQVSLHV
jgi:hypothetical protein